MTGGDAERSGGEARRVRVLMVTAAFPPVTGGVPMHTALLAENLGAAGIDVEVATQIVDGKLPEPGTDPVVVRRFPGYLSGFNTQSPQLWMWIARHSHEYDVVHVHNYHSLLLLPASLLSRSALVLTPHYHGTGHSRARRLIHPAYRYLGARAFGKAAAVICVSQPEAALVRSHFPRVGPVHVVPNGVNGATLATAPPTVRRTPFLLSAGRLERYKRVDLLIDAVAGLADPVELVVVGEGPERRNLEEHAAATPAPERITFLGRVDDPTLHGLLRGARLVVSASTEEAFGLIVAEGLAAGRQVVVSDIPAHRYVATLNDAASAAVGLVDPAGGAAAYRSAIEAQLRLAPPDGPIVMPSWRDVAELTAEVYRSVAEGPAHRAECPPDHVVGGLR